ncbi:MAG: energy-coupling factor transporter transmembrane component T [Chloroflexota bacterium]
MMVRVDPTDDQLASPLGRVSPLLKLAIAGAWFVGLFLTTEILPALALAGIAVGASLVLGYVPAGTLGRGLAPLWIAALAVGLFNGLFSPLNSDPALHELAIIGPFRLTEPGVIAGVGLASRVLAIAAIGVLFAQTTDATRLVDSLVQQGRVPERFGYGALAAYQAVPRFAEDLSTLRQARRIRGLRSSWHPRLLVGLLVLAIRHADRLALAMDARGFGTGPRSRYRPMHWGLIDLGAGAGAAVVLAIVVVLPRVT